MSQCFLDMGSRTPNTPFTASHSPFVSLGGQNGFNDGRGDNSSHQSSLQVNKVEIGGRTMKHKKDVRFESLIFHRQSQVRFIVAFLIVFARIMLIPPSPIATLIVLVAIVNLLVMERDLSEKLMVSRTVSALALLFTFEIIASPETNPSSGYE